MSFLTELKKRLSLEAPEFHKKIILFGNWLLATAIALTALPSAYDLMFPNAGIDLGLIVKISSYMGLAGFLISRVAGTAVKDVKKL